MDLTSFILLAIECNMVSNKFSLDIFYTAFKEAARNGNSEAEEEDLENRFILTNHNFFLALYNLSKALFAHDEKPFESMFAQMLTEKMVTHDKRRKYHQDICKNLDSRWWSLTKAWRAYKQHFGRRINQSLSNLPRIAERVIH